MNKEKREELAYKVYNEVFVSNEYYIKSGNDLIKVILSIDAMLMDGEWTKKLIRKLNKTQPEDLKYDL